MTFIDCQRRTAKTYLGTFFSQNFRHPFEWMSEIRQEILFFSGCISRGTCLLELIVTINRTVFVSKSVKGLREKLVCKIVAIVSTFPIFMFVDQLLLVDHGVFSAALSNLCQKTTMADFDDINLTQQFSLSIFTDFRC